MGIGIQVAVVPVEGVIAPADDTLSGTVPTSTPEGLTDALRQAGSDSPGDLQTAYEWSHAQEDAIYRLIRASGGFTIAYADLPVRGNASVTVTHPSFDVPPGTQPIVFDPTPSVEIAMATSSVTFRTLAYCPKRVTTSAVAGRLRVGPRWRWIEDRASPCCLTPALS